MRIKNNLEKLFGLIDTGATISMVSNTLIKKYTLNPIEKRELFTARGIIELPIYKSEFIYQNLSLDLEFMPTDVDVNFPFKVLLGKNFIDNFNIFLFGKEKKVAIQIA